MKPITDQRLRSLYDLLHKINPGWEVYIWIEDPKNPRIGEISFNKLVDRDRISSFYFQRGETHLADHLILACEDYLLCSSNDTDEEEAIVAAIEECFLHSE